MTSKPNDPTVEGDIASLTIAKVQQSPRRLVLLVVSLAALAGLYGAVRGSAAQPDESITEDEISAPTTELETPTTTNTPEPIAIESCDPERLAASLGRGLTELESARLPDPSALAELSPYAVRGQLIEANPREGGTRIVVKPRQIINKPGLEPILRFDALWTPALDPPTGILEGNFVAFLTGERTEAGWLPRLDGLWVSCDDTSAAHSALIDATWDREVSLNDLWLASPAQAKPLRPTSVEDRAVIFSVDVADGSRFRLRLPGELSDGLIQTAVSTPAIPVRIEGPAVSIEILYRFCSGAADSAVATALGSLVWLEGDTARVCRERDQLRMNVIANWDGQDEGLEMLDLRAVSIGSEYRAQLLGIDPGDSSCVECQHEFGPLTFSDQGVVVTMTSATAMTALHQDTLEELWTADPGGFDTFLVHGGDGLYVNAVGRSLLKLDPATGAELWRLQRGSDERALGLSGDLVWASFSIEGDHTAPILRRFDPNTGQTLWTARGRTGTEWQRSRPTVIDGVVVMMDVPDYGGPAPSDAALLAFDYETGELAWNTTLGESPNFGSVGQTEFADLQEGRVLLARTMYSEFLRVNPTDGEIMWRTTVSNGWFGGTDYTDDGVLAIDIRTPTDQSWLLDPSAGEVLQPDPN